MANQVRLMSMESRGPRVSPYPLRSSRTSEKLKAYELPIQTEGPREWEDVRCVICMEPPHNAILLNCCSSAIGCRPYMCDTSGRHSNCYKMYSGNNMNRSLTTKKLECPLCRGEVLETLKVSGARRFMNAKPRSCSVDDCEFAGTYAQLQNHSKTKHPGSIEPKVDPMRQSMWEQRERDAEMREIMSVAGINPQGPEISLVRLRRVGGAGRNRHVPNRVIRDGNGSNAHYVRRRMPFHPAMRVMFR